MGQSAAHCICASEVAAQYLFVVHVNSGGEVGVEFVADFHILEQPEDNHGGLLSAEPEVSAIAMVYQPQSGLRQHRAIRMSEAQQADRIRGCLSRIVAVKLEEGVIVRRPARLSIIHNGLFLNQCADIFSSAVGDSVESE